MINLLNIPVFYINLDEDEEKRKRTETMLKMIGFHHVTRVPAVKHEKGRIVGCARSHYNILNIETPPFIILEDDLSLNCELDTVVIDVDDIICADAIYLGISHWGRYLNHSGPYVHVRPSSDSMVQIYNMLSTHAILYLSETYVDVCARIAHYHGYVIEDHVDIGFAEIQKYYNVYALNYPLFRQYEWSAVTTGKLTDHSYNSFAAEQLFQEVLTTDQNYYKINETFKSPIQPLLEKRDVNGVPGYYLPTRIV